MGRKPKPKECPKCGHKRIARIHWGTFAFTEEVKDMTERGLWYMGGCLVTPEDSVLKWYCNKCEFKWTDEKEE